MTSYNELPLELTGLVSEPPQASPRAAESRLPAALDLGRYAESGVTLDPANGALWFEFKPVGVPIFTLGLLAELKTAHRKIHQLVREKQPGAPAPVKFFVCCSATPDVFSFGGDLALFKRCVREQDRASLLAYAYACVEAIYNNAFGYDVPVVSIGVIEGDALGGGFEGAISFNVLIAERGARMGMPEVLFNSFPGMGAYSFLSRKLDPMRAEKMILSGKTFLAEELHEMGVVDILAEPGQGREAARVFMAENQRKHTLLHALNKVSRRVNPLTLQELRDVTEIWVETVLAIEDREVRKMEILRAAQVRRLNRSKPTAAAVQDCG